MIVSTANIEDVVCFTVPHLTPPTANHYKEPTMYTGKDGFAHRGFKVTPEAKAFKDAVAIFARGRTVAPATEKERKAVRYRVGVHVVLGPRARMDCDNSSKVALDALQAARVIHSDAKVVECVLTIDRDDRTHPRTEFFVTRMEDE
jgi:Holliday junction resolvase RusA-like endonuclease